MSEQPSSNQETAKELADRMQKPAGNEWVSFDNHFYHGCCECGLSHRVVIARDGDGHQVRWTYDKALTEETRRRHDHPVWQRVAELERATSLLNGALALLQDENAKLRASVPPPDAQLINDLSMLVRRLAHTLREWSPAHPLPDRAIDFLKRKGIAGSILREAPTKPATRTIHGHNADGSEQDATVCTECGWEVSCGSHADDCSHRAAAETSGDHNG